MSFESDLYAELSGDVDLIALVSDRIYPSHAAEGTAFPFVVYTPIFNEAIYSLGGSGDMAKVRLQVDCYAENPDTAAEIARAVIAAIPESGDLHRASHSNQDLGLEEDTRLFRRMIEFSIFHSS